MIEVETKEILKGEFILSNGDIGSGSFQFPANPDVMLSDCGKSNLKVVLTDNPKQMQISISFAGCTKDGELVSPQPSAVVIHQTIIKLQYKNCAISFRLSLPEKEYDHFLDTTTGKHVYQKLSEGDTNFKYAKGTFEFFD